MFKNIPIHKIKENPFIDIIVTLQTQHIDHLHMKNVLTF